MENYYQISPVVEKIVMQENPATILEISGYNCCYGKLFQDCHKRMTHEKTKIDRILLTDDDIDISSHVYSRMYPSGKLDDINSLSKYEFIFVAHLLENMNPDEAISLIKKLQHRVLKQILVITPEYPYNLSREGSKSSIREYHPIRFIGFDFSYWMFYSFEENWQFYSFYCAHNYKVIKSDELPQSLNELNKLRVAYILPHKNLTGGMKALLQQMKQLALRGYTVDAYLRTNKGDTVIPQWSDLTDEDIHEQITVPISSSFPECIKEADIIIVGWMQHLVEFNHSHIPVVLWEQGSEKIYGDYGELLRSSADERNQLSSIYRMHAHLFAVSDTIIKALSGKYNRKAQLLPPYIDVDFYYPAEKNNTVPIILLVGNPYLPFKGFEFALNVLLNVWNRGTRFIVHWACQLKPPEFTASFPIEYYEMPPQEKLAELYRQADIFLSTSLYESFPLPPIEAMASGTAVLATDSGGIRMYAVPGENCLLCDQGDINSMAGALAYLLDYPDQRRLLAVAGRETAMRYAFNKITDKLEEYLNMIVQSHKKDV